MENQRRKIIIDIDVEYPHPFDADAVARIMRDYMNLNRFVIGSPEISVYPLNTKVVQNPILMTHNEKDLTH